MTSEIPLSNGGVAFVDDADFELISQFKWHKSRYGYAVRMQHVGGNWKVGTKKNKLIMMHRLLLQTPVSMHTDHINGNRLDNQRSNLRIVTQMQNAQNVRKATEKNPFIGACWNKGVGKWQAQIRLWGKLTYLGLFDSQEAASNAYKDAARKHRGEFSNVD